MSASKKLQAEDALQLLKNADFVYASKGKQTAHFDLKNDRPDEATLLRHLLGATGNLRAPLLVCGRAVLVGFNQEVYQTILD